MKDRRIGETMMEVLAVVMFGGIAILITCGVALAVRGTFVCIVYGSCG